MNTLTEARRALRRTWRTPRLVLLLWSAHLVIAGIAFYPVLRHLDAALANAPAGDEFLRRFSLPLLSDLMRAGGGWFQGLGPLLLLVAVLTILWNPLAAGGALESLLSGDPSRLAHRFGRGAGRFFGRFVRMGLAAVPAALLVAGILAGPIFGVRASLDDTAEGAKFWLGLAGILVALFAILLVQLALDLARIRVARDDVRKGVRVFRATLRAVLRRPWQVLAIWLPLALVFVAISALYLGFRGLLPPSGGVILFALVLAQQLVMIARAGLRVALWSGEIALADRKWPAAPLASRLAAGART
ncbi:MAG: hypothetical protein ABI689_13945 [Thermoanaerobaculia bacterium]